MPSSAAVTVSLPPASVTVPAAFSPLALMEDLLLFPSPPMPPGRPPPKPPMPPMPPEPLCVLPVPALPVSVSALPPASSAVMTSVPPLTVRSVAALMPSPMAVMYRLPPLTDTQPLPSFSVWADFRPSPSPVTVRVTMPPVISTESLPRIAVPGLVTISVPPVISRSSLVLMPLSALPVMRRVPSPSSRRSSQAYTQALGYTSPSVCSASSTIYPLPSESRLTDPAAV